MTGGRGVPTKRTVLVGLVVTTVLAGAGVGLIAPTLDRPAADASDAGGVAGTPGTPDPTVTPPTPNRTPAGGDGPDATTATATVTSASGDDGEGDAGGDSHGSASDPVGGGGGDATGASDSDGSGSDGRASSSSDGDGHDADGDDTERDGGTDGDGASGPEGAVSPPVLTASATAPDDVRNDAGAVPRLAGTVSGVVEWDGDADTAVFVVSGRVSGGEWVEAARRTVRADGGRARLNATAVAYANASRAAAFDNPTDASAVTRTGSVAVTAVLFDDGAEVARVTETLRYEFAAYNTGTVSLRLGGDGGVEALDASGVAPGASGAHSVVVRNDGAADGSLAVGLRNLDAAENGVAEPERGVDRADAVELADAVSVRVGLRTDDDTTYAVGGPDRFVGFADLREGTVATVPFAADEERTVVVE